MTLQKKAILVALTTLIVAPASHGWGQIYKVIDGKDGVVFTDSPGVIGNTDSQSVEKIELEETNSATPIQARPPAASSANPSAESQTIEKPRVSIAAPANESTIAMGPGNFTVSASASPALTSGEQLILLMDGVPQGGAQSSGNWTIEGALRGPHDLVVQRTTSRGKVVASSEPVRVYVLRPSIIGR
ncbi:hypothetical protein R0135_12430 [Congregibacter variabilis]|uniref:DUF4124 domain-containing protein n=1 Tax=Congregibacter variabilis TaxID=3081200 RepID=A0ABZ0I1D2_9GAMM|nr:hypothetical protein R0135_12430 [Congregibacter sp. IMCC43200]